MRAAILGGCAGCDHLPVLDDDRPDHRIRMRLAPYTARLLKGTPHEAFVLNR